MQGRDGLHGRPSGREEWQTQRCGWGARVSRNEAEEAGCMASVRSGVSRGPQKHNQGDHRQPSLQANADVRTHLRHEAGRGKH
jgi:hypothetical protein